MYYKELIKEGYHLSKCFIKEKIEIDSYAYYSLFFY